MEALSACPKCGVLLNPDEKFCPKCGADIAASAADAKDIGARIGLKHEKQAHQQRIRSGRTTILVVAILTLIGGGLMFALGSANLAKDRKEIEAARGNELYDQEQVEQAARENKKLSALNTLLLPVNIVLALSFFGLWVWAKQRPLPATLAALILYITVIVASGVLEPASLGRGLILKIVIIAFLIKSVDSARKFQRMQEHGV